MNMFDYLSTIGFIVRVAIFCMCFASYPLISMILRTQFLNAILPNKSLTKKQKIMFNCWVQLFPMTISLFSESIGSILTYTGSISGFLLIFTLPVAVHLRKKYLEITNPLFLETLTRNESLVESKQGSVANREDSAQKRRSMIASLPLVNKSETASSTQ